MAISTNRCKPIQTSTEANRSSTHHHRAATINSTHPMKIFLKSHNANFQTVDSIIGYELKLVLLIHNFTHENIENAF